MFQQIGYAQEDNSHKSGIGESVRTTSAHLVCIVVAFCPERYRMHTDWRSVQVSLKESSQYSGNTNALRNMKCKPENLAE
ncbi:hypothetical protein NW801_12310 [Brevibacillus laterosporus]|uniref:Uncharacterized protein n=1 Tax=Brevibacillus halotolerans TaxID=1507437 RepID=A0ABT4HXM4_9BACL|nr:MULTISPECIES: hypothetical protein [Brevibacillus]MCR8985820.1 hypothetical protein [Brevibacillus laterosporus]MCZ0831553.1 hypothetical protein [Brevibacillus halotolerans]